MTTRRLPTRYHRALALEPRILLDAAATATAETVIAATDSKPGVTARGVEATVTISATDTRQSVDLFSGVSVSADGSSQALTSLVISVNSTGSNQALVIDGSTITLAPGSGGTASNGYFYTASVSGSTTTITLALNASIANSTADVARLIDGISYVTLDNSVASRNVTVTLDSLSDSGDTTALGISSSIAITSTLNVAPELAGDATLDAAETFTIEALGSASEVLYSSNGRYAYVSGESGISVFSVDGLGRLTLSQTMSGITDLNRVNHMVMSADGQSIYALSGSNLIVQLRVAADGRLAYAASFNTENGEASGSLAISADGAYLYVGTASNGLVILDRDTTSGALSVLGRAPQDNSRHATVITAGDYVYALYTDGSHVVYVYSRNSDGTLDTVATLVVGASEWEYDPVDYALVASADGKQLFIGDPAHGTLQILTLNGSTLTRVTNLSLNGLSDLALSDDGTVLYVSQSDGTLSAYSVASNGSLSPSSSFSRSGDISDIALSGDGLSLLVAGSSVSRYTAIQDLNAGQALSFAGGLTLSDSNYAVLANGAGNYRGASITVSADVSSGSFGFAASNTLSLSNDVIALNGSAIATLTRSASGVTVSFSADVTAAVGNQVLHQLTYSNSTIASGSLIRLSVVGRDSQLSSNTVLLTLRASSAPLLNSDAATGYTLNTATSETAYRFTLLADLFSEADGDNLTWSVSGLPEGLSFDAATHTIQGATKETGTFMLTVSVQDAAGSSASLPLELLVEQIDNRAPQASDTASTTLASATQNVAYSTTLDSTLFSDGDSLYGDTLSWSVSGLPDGLVFDSSTRTLSGTAALLGRYSVTVTVTDAAGLSASSELTLRVIDSTEASNQAPTFSADASALSYSSDGDLSGFEFFVNSITLSDDGATLVIAANTHNENRTNSGEGTSYLMVYSRDTDSGALTLKQRFTQGTSNDGDDSNGIEVDGLRNVTSVAWSADGSLLYLSGYSATGSATAYSLSAFSVDSDSSTLSLIGSVANIGEKVVDIQVSDNGNVLYALSASTVYSYATGDNGALTARGAYSNDLGSAVALQVDGNGTVYVLGGSRMTLYTTASDGSLVYAGQLLRSSTTLTYTDNAGTASVIATLENPNAFSGNASLAVADDGHVYLVTGSGFLTTLHYDRADNSLSLPAALEAYTPFNQFPSGVVMSADGSALYVTSGATDRIAVYAIAEDGRATLSKVIETSGGTTRIAVSADGKSIYAGPHIYFDPGLRLISSSGTQVAYQEGGTLALARSLTISDTEYDALAGGTGNYNGAIISLVRASGADSNDTYGFADSNGLVLQAGVISLNGTAIARLSSGDGAMSITFTADVSSAVANQVLHQVTYTNPSDNPGSRITLTLSVTDTYTVSSTQLLLVVSEINNAPTLSATGSAMTYSVGGSAMPLFSNIDVSAGETGQSISQVTLTISGITDADRELLSLGGQIMPLSNFAQLNGEIIAADGETYRYIVTVELVDGTATLTLASDGSDSDSDYSASLPVDALNRVLDSLGYSSISDTASGTRTITLTSITDNGGTDNGGINTTALAITSTLTLSQSNSSPTLSANAATVTWQENTPAPSLFSNVVLSTGEAGQGLASLTLSVSGLLNGSSETLNLDGTAIALVTGSGTTANGYIYSVTFNAGTATVVITRDSFSVSAATALISGLSYGNSSDDPTAGSRSVTLSAVQDNGGTGNGSRDSTALAIAARIDVVPVNEAPVLQATVTNSSYAAAGSSMTLFSNVQLSTVESGQAISTVTFTVSGLLDGANETLNLDGTRIALVAGSGSTEHYRYTVSLAGNTASVVITASNAITAGEARTLIAQASYANLSGTQSAGARSFGLSVQDNGGVANGGADSSTLARTATLNVVDNATPQLSAGPDDHVLQIADSLTAISGLSDIAASALSNAGDYLYVLASDGNLAIFSRNTASGDLQLVQVLDSDLDSASGLVLSDDGSHLYVLGNDGDSIAVFSRSTGDGSLVLQQTLVTENVVDLATASDAGALYVVDGTYSGLRVYSLDSSGQYVLSQSIAASTSSEPYLFSGVAVRVSGDYVYVVTDPASSAANTLIVYQAGSDGQLSAVAWLRDGQPAGDSNVVLGNAVDVTLSADGRTVYVASSNGVSIFALDTDSNTLSYRGQLSGLSTVSGVAVSSDGDTLYVTSADSISRYKVDGTRLTLLGSFSTRDSAALAGTTDVLSAGNGSVVVIGGAGVVSLTDHLTATVPLAWTEQGSVRLAERLHLSDANYDVLANGAGNYNGASLSVVREGTANAADRYSLQAGDGLTLTDGVVYLNGAAIATFVASEGALTLRFTADVTTATANAVLQRISYSNSSKDPGTTVRLSLSVSDAYAAKVSTTLLLTVTTINDAPTLSTTAANTTYTEGSNAVSLFSGSVVSSVEAGQSITGLTLTVSGLSDGSSEVLTVDGTAIALVAGTGTTVSGYRYSVTLDAGVATLTLSATLNDTAASALVNGLTYANTSQDPSSGSRIINLTQLQDNGGTANGGTDSSTLSSSATVSVVAANNPPVITTTAATTPFIEGGSAVSLFSASTVSTVEAGQSITRLGLSVTGLSDGNSEVLSVDGTSIALVNGNGTTTSGYRYDVNLANGIATVTLTSSGMSTTAAATLLDGLTYRNGSTDPTAGNRSIILAVAQDSGGTEGAALGMTAVVSVSSINEAPVLSTTPATAIYTEGGTPASLFSATAVDSHEAGQGIASLTLTVAGLRDGNGEVLTVNGTAIALVNGRGTTTAGYGYSVTLSDGVATVTLSGTAISNTDAATLVNGLNYTNTRPEPSTGSRVITLTGVQDNGGTANGGVDSTVLNSRATVEVIASNDAPTLTATAVTASHTAGDSAVLLFSDTQVSTVESQQAITALTLTVSGVRDSHEVLSIDGATVLLSHGTTLITASGLTVSVVLADGTATLILGSASGLSAEATQALVNSLGYANDSTQVSTGTRTISLVTVQDDGGTANGGRDTATLNLSASVTVLNNAPLATATPAELAMATAREDYRAVLPAEWFSDANGDSLSWSVSGLPTGLSFDAASLTLSGVAQTAGSYTLTVTVTDSAGATASRSLTLEVDRAYVQPRVPIDTPRALPSAFTSQPAFTAAPFEALPISADSTPPLLSTTGSAPDLAARGARDTTLATGTGTVAEQLVEADGLHSDSLASLGGGDFVLEGSTLVSRVAPAADGARTATLTLPAQLPDGTQPTRVALASGLPLPNWVRFDPRSGQVQIDRAQLTRLGTVRLIVTGRDIDGQERKTELHINSDQRTGQGNPAPARDSEAPGVPAQLRQSAPSALLEDARALLESLSGLNPQDTTASARHNA